MPRRFLAFLQFELLCPIKKGISALSEIAPISDATALCFQEFPQPAPGVNCASVHEQREPVRLLLFSCGLI